MNRTESHVNAPLLEVDRLPIGRTLAVSEGQVNGVPFDVIVTEQEVHFAFADRNGPRFAINLNALMKDTTNAIEMLLGKPRGTR